MTEKKPFLRDLQGYIDRCLSEFADESELEQNAIAKLDGILSAHSANADGATLALCKSVRAFIAENETNKRKLSCFCVDFSDPTASRVSDAAGREIVNHAYLEEDEIDKLYRFIKRHESDLTFGQTLDKLMKAHQTTSPKVYKAAMLRRQDFARVYDPNVKSVSKQLAWQVIIGLHCTLEEADELLYSAGYVRRRNKFDLIMEYFITRQNYDVMAINEVLCEFGLKPFSCNKPVHDDDPFQ